MKRVGIIRCQNTEYKCAGRKDFLAVKENTDHLQGLGEAEVVGFFSCGGCKGEKVVDRIQVLLENGVDVLSLSTCLVSRCSNLDALREVVEKAVADQPIQVVYGTHC